MKGIKHGACDYMVKSVCLEQLRGIWTHVVKNSKTDPRNNICDDVVRKLPSGDGDKVEKIGANHTKKYSRKTKRLWMLLMRTTRTHQPRKSKGSSY